REAVTDLKKVKREVESGVSGGMPMLEGVGWWFGSLTSRGMIGAAVAGAVVGGLLIAVVTGGARSNLFPLVMALAAGAWIFRRFRNRGEREMRRFVKKAAALKEVRVV